MAELAEFLLHFLLLTVNEMTIRQAARLLALPLDSNKPFNLGSIQPIIRELVRRGLIHKKRLPARHPLMLVEPLISYRHGITSQPPNFAGIPTILEKRAAEPVDDIVCIYATRAGADDYGGVAPDLSKVGQYSHDLNVAEILVHEYLAKKNSGGSWDRVRTAANPDLEDRFSTRGPLEHIRAIEKYFTNHWRGEQWLKANGMSLDGYVPDIAVVSDGQILTAIDAAGKYDLARLEQIYADCVGTGTNLFIW